MSNKIVKVTVVWVDPERTTGSLVTESKFDKAAVEPAGLVVFDDTSNGGRVKVYPWHRIKVLYIGSDPDHPHASTS